MPLAHAHVDGQNAAQSVHLAMGDVHGYVVNNHDFDSIDVSQHSAHEHDSSVVCMQPEYRSSDVTIAPTALIIVKQIVIAQIEPLKIPSNESTLQQLSPSPFQRPFSQAPPAPI